jgi:NAD(P)-dependent dehydrogenase (short-subunit alcohol dehydrogenase family)
MAQANPDLSPRLGSPNSAVIITGGASGIGLASAEALAAVGRPVALWDINAGRVKDEAQRLAATYKVATHAVAVDLRNPQAMVPSVNETRAALPRIGGLVHAAGTVDHGSLEAITPESWDAHMNIHLRALPLLIQALLEDLKANNPGSAIVAIASINGTLGNGHNPIYTAAKGGMRALVRSLADRLAQDGIRVNTVSPGFTVTPMMQPTINALGADFFTKRVLLGRFGEPAELGRTVRFLLSDEASYVTAAELIVDGGTVYSQR